MQIRANGTCPKEASSEHSDADRGIFISSLKKSLDNDEESKRFDNIHSKPFFVSSIWVLFFVIRDLPQEAQ